VKARFLVLGIVLVCVLAIVGQIARAAPTARTAVLGCNGHALVRPAGFVVTCADANVAWRAVRWSHWNATGATGRGQIAENDCVPYCAAGHFHAYPATITLSRPVATHRYGRLFSRATFLYLEKGKRKTQTWQLGTGRA